MKDYSYRVETYYQYQGIEFQYNIYSLEYSSGVIFTVIQALIPDTQIVIDLVNYFRADFTRVIPTPVNEIHIKFNTLKSF